MGRQAGGRLAQFNSATGVTQSLTHGNGYGNGAKGSAGELECQARLASTHYVSTHNNRDFHEKILKNPMIFYFSHFFFNAQKIR